MVLINSKKSKEAIIHVGSEGFINKIHHEEHEVHEEEINLKFNDICICIAMSLSC